MSTTKPLNVNISVRVIYITSINRYIAVYDSDIISPQNAEGVAALGRTPWQAIRKMTAKAKVRYEPKGRRSKCRKD